MNVTAAEIGAPMDRAYDLTGTADHSHPTTVTEAQLATLATNAPVTLTSSFDDGHAHTVEIRCR